MKQVVEGVAFYARWTAWWLKQEVRELWRSMPGPWWVKALIVGLCLAIPGPQDEILLVLVLAGLRKWRQHRVQTAEES